MPVTRLGAVIRSKALPALASAVEHLKREYGELQQLREAVAAAERTYHRSREIVHEPHRSAHARLNGDLGSSRNSRDHTERLPGQQDERRTAWRSSNQCRMNGVQSPIVGSIKVEH